MIKQVNAKIQVLLEQVSRIYQNPRQYTYLLYKNDGFIYIYDEGTMQIIGKTKGTVNQQMKLFAFTKDFNIFFSMRQGKLMQYNLTFSGYIMHLQINQQNYQQKKPYFQAYHLQFCSQKQQIMCITKKNIYFILPKNGYYYLLNPIMYNNQTIYPQYFTQMGGFIWIIGYKNYIYLLKLSDKEGVVKSVLQVGNIIKIQRQDNPLNEYFYVINDINQIMIIKVNKSQMEMYLCFKYMQKDLKFQYLSILRPGIDTSTTNKLKNKLYLLIYAQQIKQFEQRMIDQNEQRKQQNQENKNYSLLIILTQIQNHFTGSQQITKLKPEEQSFIIKYMPHIKSSPWINVLNQNKIFFLTKQNKVSYINLCSIKQLKLNATQWSCMGYKFQVLQKNQVYEEKQNQFEDQSVQEQINLTKEYLDDWSESLFSKDYLKKKNFLRIKILDF